MRSTSLALVLVALLAAPLLADAEGVQGADQTRHVRRTVALPTTSTPFVIFDVLSDRVAWRVDVDPLAVVVLDARADATSPFHLRYHPWRAPTPQSPLPGPVQSVTMDGAAARSWYVEIDPAMGANVDIVARFHGHVGGDGGALWPFTLSDTQPGPGCQDACLP